MATAWFTGAEPGPRILLQIGDPDPSRPPIVLDEDEPLGRVSLTLLETESPAGNRSDEILVSWIGVDDKGAVLRLARLDRAGALLEVQDVCRRSGERGEGVPQLSSAGPRAWLVWTDLSEPSQLRGVVVERGPVD